MSFQAFLKEIEKGLPLPVYLLHVTDSFLQREALGAIKRLVPESERDFNFHIFDLSSSEETTSMGEIIDLANMFPFFGKRKFVVLFGNLQRLSEEEQKTLDAYVSNPAPTSVFVIFHGGELKKDMKERFRNAKIIFLDIKEGEIPSWIKQKAEVKGLTISDDVAEYLLGLIGSDLGLLSAEIEKISLLGKERVSIEDISEITAGGGFYSPFDLVEALREKDAERVLKIYTSLRGTAEDYSLIGVLNWLYGRQLPYRKGEKDAEYLFKVFEILHEADRDIKSSGRDFPMEYLLIKLLRLEGAEGHLPSS